MVVDMEVLLECLNSSIAESISLRVVGSRETQFDGQAAVALFAKLVSKLSTTIAGDM